METNIATEERDAINARFVFTVNYLLEHKLAKNKNEIIENLGLYMGRLSILLKGTANVSTDNLANLCKAYGVSPLWLLMGAEPIITGQPAPVVKAAPSESVPDTSRTLMPEAPVASLPLIPITALAGFNGVEEPGVRLDECAQYVVPEFVEAGADFLIRIKGNSMIPTFASGDLVACRKVSTGAWIEYGDAYVIDGEQGVMIKRIYNDPQDDMLLLCKSDNPEVAPFSIRKDEIRSLSKVIGIIRNN